MENSTLHAETPNVLNVAKPHFPFCKVLPLPSVKKDPFLMHRTRESLGWKNISVLLSNFPSTGLIHSLTVSKRDFNLSLTTSSDRDLTTTASSNSLNRAKSVSL